MESYLVRCLDCATSQTLKDIEVIIINDGSTDCSLSIIEQYKKRDSRIILINQENQGLSKSRNYAIKIAMAEYLFFLDSDDDMDLDTLEMFYIEAKNNNSDIVVARGRIVKGNNITDLQYPTLVDNHFDNIMNPSFGVSAWSKLIKKSLFINNNIQFPNNQCYEDHTTMTKLFYYADNINYLEKTFYNYYKNENTITSSINKKKIDDIFLVARDLEIFLIQKNLFEKFKINVTQKIIKLLNNYAFKHLLVVENRGLLLYIIRKAKDCHLFQKENFQIKNIYNMSFYIFFITNILNLEKKYQGIDCSFFYTLYNPNIIIECKKAISFNYNTVVANILLSIVEQNNLNDIIIYCSNTITDELLILTKNKNIQVHTILDKKLNNIENLHESELLILRYPIVIASLNHIIDIKEELRSFSRLRQIEMKIFDISDAFK